jgi:hypothetical protein
MHCPVMRSSVLAVVEVAEPGWSSGQGVLTAFRLEQIKIRFLTQMAEGSKF